MNGGIFKKNLTQYNSENDIIYRGPLKVIHLRIIAWVCLWIAQIISMLTVYDALSETSDLETLINILSFFSSLSLPCFLLASFAYIIQDKTRYKKVLLTYFTMALLVILAFYVLCLKYGAVLFNELAGEEVFSSSDSFVEWLIDTLGDKLNFNIFIDLFLCALFVYFFMGEPKRFFQGEKIRRFRTLAVIPVLCELGLMALKMTFAENDMEFPAFLYPLMPTKAPLTFVAFIFIVLCEHFRKERYFKQGGTKSGYNEFLKTNENSLLFAKTTAKVFAVCGIIDLVLFLVFFIDHKNGGNASSLSVIEVYGLGKSTCLILLAPFILLFSYNKMHRPSKADIILPVIGVAVICLLYVEGIFEFFVDLIDLVVP